MVAIRVPSLTASDTIELVALEVLAYDSRRIDVYAQAARTLCTRTVRPVRASESASQQVGISHHYGYERPVYIGWTALVNGEAQQPAALQSS